MFWAAAGSELWLWYCFGLGQRWVVLWVERPTRGLQLHCVDFAVVLLPHSLGLHGCCFEALVFGLFLCTIVHQPAKQP